MSHWEAPIVFKSMNTTKAGLPDVWMDGQRTDKVIPISCLAKSR